MKVKKTNEEKKEIKKFKKDKYQRSISHEKKGFKIEYIYIAGAAIILLLLVAILIYMLFFSKGENLIVPNKPNYDILDIGVVDFADNAANAFDLNTKKNDKINVSYNIISDYYKKGITLSNTQANYLNDSFIITSGPLSKDSFISAISKDSKLKWLLTLDDKEFGLAHVYSTVSTNNAYYISAVTELSNKKNLSVIQVDNNGKRIATRTIKSAFNGKIKDMLVVDKNLIIIAQEDDQINLYFTDINLKENKNTININKQFNDSKYIDYQMATSLDNTIELVCKSDNKYYSISVNVEGYTASLKELDAINTLETDANIKIRNYLKGYVANTNDTLYKLDPDARLINKYEYKNIKLEDDSAYKEKYKDDEFINVEDMENRISIESISSNNTSIIVNSRTIYSSIYDIYDLNLNINKRIILDAVKYTYDEGVILNRFYIDGNIYEVYSYGSETPSIMISKIG